MQAGGADMLRLAACRLCEAGLVPSMLVHDAILIELPAESAIADVREIMCKAGRDVCGGLEVGVDADQVLRRGARYQDKRPAAGKMWGAMVDALADVGAVSRRGAA